jgi:long-subunit fatty acid transport protein
MRPALLSALSLLLLPAPAAGNALDFFGFGARGMAMGNAMTAAVDDGAASYYNPAALVLADHLAIEIGYLTTASSLRINGRDTNVNENAGLMGSVVIPGDIGPVRIALGLGVYLPDAWASRIRALPQSQPRFALFDNATQRLNIIANLAVRPIPELSIGAGVSFLADTRGGVALAGTFYPDAEDTVLSTSVDVDFATVRTPQAGLLWQPTPFLSLGLVWRGEVRGVLDLEADVRGAIAELLGPEPIPGRLAVSSFNSSFFSPHQVFLGVAVRPTASTLVSADVGWLGWSRWPPPTAAIDVRFDLEGFDTSELLPDAAPVQSPSFRDTFSVRLGVEQAIEMADWASVDVRGGYAFEPSPAPSQPGLTNYVDCDRHVASLGVGAGLLTRTESGRRPIEVDVAAQLARLVERDYAKSSAADLVGDYSAEGWLWAVQASARFTFPW